MKRLHITFILGAILFSSFSFAQTYSQRLIHYWHFNNLVNFTTVAVSPSTFPVIKANYSSLDTNKAILKFAPISGTAGNLLTYYDNVSPGDTINAKLSTPAGLGFRPRNPTDSMQLMLFVPSLGINNINIKFEIQRSSASNGATTLSYDYSTDSGATWKTSGLTKTTDSTGTGSWRACSTILNNDVTAFNNPNLVFRIRFNGPGTTGTSGNIRFDNISFEGDIPVDSVKSLSNTLATPSTLKFSWTKPASYVDSVMTTLVFIKQGTINVGTPNKNPISFISNTIFGSTATKYQNDTLAQCVLNSDSNSVTISNLATSTNYTVLVLAVRNVDSTYSSPATVAAFTQAVIPPPVVTYTNKLIHYWNFNNLVNFSTVAVSPSTFPLIKANYSSIDTNRAILKFAPLAGTAGNLLTYYDNVSPGDTINARLAAPAGLGLRPRNPTDSMQLMLFAPSIGYKNINIKFEIQRSSASNGATTLNYDYSTDSGATWKTNGLTKTVDSTGTGSWRACTTLLNNDPSAYNNANLVFRIRFIGPGTTGTSGNIRFDNITFDGDIPVDSVKSLANTLATPSTLKFSWTKPSTYVDSVMTTLVFIKQGAINIGVPTKNPLSYLANSVYGPNGTKYQNDSTAQCVLNSDSNSVTISNLIASTNYSVLVLAVRNVDSAYSIPAVANAFTQALPPPPVVTYTNKLIHYWNFNNLVNFTTVAVNPSTFPLIKANYSSIDTNRAILKFAPLAGTAGNLLTYYDFVSPGDTINARLAAPAGLGLRPRNPTDSMQLMLFAPSIGYKNINIKFEIQRSSASNGATTLNYDYSTDSGATWKTNGLTKTVDSTGTGSWRACTTLLNNDPSAYNNANLVFRIRFIGPGTTGTSGNIRFDNITFDGDIPVDSVKQLSSSLFTTNSLKLSWVKPSSYVDSTMTTVVFLKSGSPINSGIPTQNTASYIANSNFLLSNSVYQNDANAKCVLNSDSTSITILGLTQNTTYYAIVYAVRVTDSTYSIAASSSGVTQSLPAPTNVSNTRFTNTTTTSTVLSWTKDVSYVDSTLTTLVFIKPTSTINKGTPNKSALTYVANASNYNNGSSFQNDTSAKCVFNGTANTVSISGLASSTKYNFLIYVVKKLDSTYSSGVTDTISTLTPLLPPASISATKFTNTSTTATTLSWTKDPSYVDSTLTTLVFIKPTASITKGTPNKSASNYIANASNYNNGTSYQNDTAAKCVFNGNANTVSIFGLSASTKYNFLIYVVRKVDSSYSSGATDTMSTLAPAPIPTAVTALTLTGSSYTSARATWTKPANYDNANWTTLVFAKSDLPITVGTPTKGQANYTSNSNFGLGTSYQNDALGYCVFKGDTNTVNILGLLQNKTYQVMVVIVRDADSVYSPAANTNGTVTPYPLYTISQISTTNATTGNPDSLGVKARIRGIVYGFNQVATSGFQFVIKDNTGGITAFNISKSFGYLVTEGDNLEVGGIVSVNRGLITFNCDTLIKLSSGNTLTNPTLVTSLNQTTENNLVRINNIEFYTSPGTTWPLANTTILCHTHGLNDTIAVSILATSGLAGNPLPTTPSFSIIGLGTQVSTSVSAPFLFNGYRIIPRNNSDIIAIPVPADTLSKFTLKSPANNSSINLQGDPTTTVNFSWKTAISSITGLSAKYSIELDSLTGTFANGIKLQSNAAGLDSNYTTTYGALSTLLNLIPSKQVTLKWRIKATAGTYVKYDDTVFVVTFVRGQFTGINELGSTHQITLYPNPATNQIAIGSNHSIESISIIDITGNMMDSPMTKDNTTIYCDINQLVSGVYFVKVIGKDQSVVYKKFIKE